MSSAISHAAALRRPFIFDADAEPEVGSHTARVLASIGKNGQKLPSASVTPASQLEIRPAPEMVSSGIPALDALTGGLPRGCLTEVCGLASSGRTTVLLAALAAATRRREFCALIDASDALDPHSLAAAGVDCERLLWVRCGENSPQRHPSTSLRAGSDTEKGKNQKEPFRGPISRAQSRTAEHRLEQGLRATDLLLESGGFGLIVLDLADLPPQAARRIPLTTWFRFRRAVEHKSTILLAIEQQRIAGSCSSLLLQLGGPSSQFPVSQNPSHTQLLASLEISAELVRSRLERKPARSITFETKTAWAG